MFEVFIPELMPFYLALGGVVGFLAGLLGVGGGVVLVPSLYYLLTTVGADHASQELVMHQALATSMATILPTGLSSSWAQMKRKAVDWDAIKLMMPGLVLGVVLGLFVVTSLKSDILKAIFSIGLYGVAISMIFRKEADHATPALKKKPIAFLWSTGFGVFATLLGVGGAVLNIPYLNRAGWSMKTAIACGSVLGVVVSIPATLGYIGMAWTSHGAESYIRWSALAMIVPVSVLVAPLGVKASHALPVKKLKVIFAIVLLGVATKMLMSL